jgi:hypothetical protein
LFARDLGDNNMCVGVDYHCSLLPLQLC